MRAEQAIVQVIPITKEGEIRRFTLKVPMNALAVTGIETGIRMIGEPRYREAFSPPPRGRGGDPVLVRVPVSFIAPPPRYPVVGEVKLQSPTKPDVFYGTLIRDPYAGEDFANPFIIPGMPDRDWRNGYKKVMEPLLVDAHTTVITGIYQDFLGAALERDIFYEIFLAVWFKINTAQL